MVEPAGLTAGSAEVRSSTMPLLMWRCWWMRMMDKHELFESWVRSTWTWSNWAKPVLFARWNRTAQPLIPAVTLPDVSWVPPVERSTAIVIDLLGAQSVMMGLALA